MISAPAASDARRKGEKHAQRIILNSLLWGYTTRIAAADHAMRRSRERSVVISGNDINSLAPSGLVRNLEPCLQSSEQGLGFLPRMPE